MPDVSEIPETYNYVSTKLTLGVMGLKRTTLSQEPVNHVPLLNKKKILYKIR